MSILDDIKSGKCAIYGQFSALASIVFLILFGVLNLVSTLIIFAVLGWIFAGIIILIEIPFCTCCVNDTLTRMSRFFQANQFKAALYLVFAVIIWLSTRVGNSTMIISAIFLTLSSFFYGVAAFRKEDPAKSTFNGSTAQAATSTLGGRV
ncbi:hypothetical protein BC831DRAFT_435570 [Entophlyctis helioformis]|nr:hypothetical protein BC831DRAFT_435570 [Entophlyctis helioformis]